MCVSQPETGLAGVEGDLGCESDRDERRRRIYGGGDGRGADRASVFDFVDAGLPA